MNQRASVVGRSGDVRYCATKLARDTVSVLWSFGGGLKMQSCHFQFMASALSILILAGVAIEPLAKAAEATAGDQLLINQQHRAYNAKLRAKKSAQEQEKVIVNHRKALLGQEHGMEVPKSPSGVGVLQGNKNNTGTDYGVSGPYIGLKYRGNE